MRNTGVCGAVACGVLLLLAGCSTSSSSPGTCAAGCGGGLSCVTNGDFPTGVCTAVCTGGGCPSGTACTPPLSTGNSYCLPTCGTGGTSCPDSLACTPTSKGSLCLAPAVGPSSPVSCAAPQLVVGATAGPATEPSCRIPVVASALQASDVQKLGTHSPGESVVFHVPAGATGFSIVSQAETTVNPFIDCGPGFGLIPNIPVPSPILTPAGTTFYDELLLPPLDLTTASLLFFRAGGQVPYSQALTFPNTSAGLALALDGGLPTGQWSFEVNDYANVFSGPGGGCDAGPLRNTYDVQVVVSPGPLLATTHLSMDVYLVTQQFRAATAVNNPAVQRFANAYASVFAGAGVCVTTVTFHDVPPWAINKYSSLSSVDDAVVQQPCSDFRQMMTLAEPGRTMALFLVDELAPVDAQGNQTVGQDGAIPGMGSYNGATVGGAAASLADLSATGNCGSGFSPYVCGPDFTALIAAHETGHFLGLFHPTEQTGDFFDPLVDTAACVCALCETGVAATNCSDGGQATLVDDSVCSGATAQCGGANLAMFWLLTQADKGQFSPQEAAILRANPLLSAP